MPPEQADLAYLWDMQHAADDVAEFVAGLTFDAFARDKRTRFAVERQLLVIGEAAGRVSEGTREQYTEIPWTSMIGLRNVLAHDYGDILV
jgi:uncharacterized protein with HEPN domain